MALASVFRRLLKDCRGQDVVEYALLAATVGLSAAVSFGLLLEVIGAAYADRLHSISLLP